MLKKINLWVITRNRITKIIPWTIMPLWLYLFSFSHSDVLRQLSSISDPRENIEDILEQNYDDISEYSANNSIQVEDDTLAILDANRNLPDVPYRGTQEPILSFYCFGNCGSNVMRALHDISLVFSSLLVFKRRIHISIAFSPTRDFYRKVFASQSLHSNNDTMFLYPQAMLPQADPDNFELFDCKLYFNSQVKWLFGSHSHKGRYDFRFVLTQLILESLGLFSSWKPLKIDTSATRILPDFANVETLGLYHFDKLLESGFDRYLVYNDSFLSEYILKLENDLKIELYREFPSLSDLKLAILNSSAYQSTRLLKHIVETPKSIMFNISSNQTLGYIDTTHKPLPISRSLSKLDLMEVKGTPDELLMASVYDLRDIEAYCNSSTRELFGQKTRAMLRALGWKLYEQNPSRLCTAHFENTLHYNFKKCVPTLLKMTTNTFGRIIRPFSMN